MLNTVISTNIQNNLISLCIIMDVDKFLQKLSIENMSLLLDSYTLKNVSELELFEASRQWLLKQSERFDF